jgi:NCS1 family nucleobase:cation symporter-1
MGNDILNEVIDSDRIWRIETHGIDAIEEAERHGKPHELFWIWFAANIGLLAVTYGSFLIVFFGLNLWQVIIVTILGVGISFALVGLVGLAGKRGGAPTLVLSRAAFGVFGNALPTLVSYLTLVGFETVGVCLAALATQSVLAELGLARGNQSLAIAFILIVLVSISISLLGHATIVEIQKWFTVAFSLLTVVFIILTFREIDFQKLLAYQGSASAGTIIAALSFVIAGTGLTWANVGADYTRYLPKSISSGSIIFWTIFGSLLPLFILIVFGAMLSVTHRSLATTSNPIGALAAALPSWFLIPYMVTAAGGIVAEVLLASYSGGLNLLTMGLRVARYKSIVVDALLMLAGSVYILFFAPSFFAPFDGFLLTIGTLLAAWVGVFLLDLLNRKSYDTASLCNPRLHYGSINPAGVIAFVLGSIVGLGLVASTSPIFSWTGYLLGVVGGKNGLVAVGNLGLIVAILISGLTYASLNKVLTSKKVK